MRTSFIRWYTGCPYKEKCTKARGNKRLYVSKSFLEKRKESYQNIQSEKGIKYRVNRSIQVEGAFGVLKNDYGFQRFLLRGKKKVKREILMLSMGYNLNKLHRKIQNERTGRQSEGAAQSSILMILRHPHDSMSIPFHKINWVCAMEYEAKTCSLTPPY